MISQQDVVQAHTPSEGDIRISYIPQIPGRPFQAIFPVNAVETFDERLTEAAQALDAIVNFSIFEFENRVKPDYSDMALIEYFDSDGDWEEIDEEQWEQLI